MTETSLLPDIACHTGKHISESRKGIQLSFVLIEPVVFLQGHGTGSSACKDKAAVVRGSLHLKVTEPTKIKRICVYFRGLVKLELSEDANNVVSWTVKLVGNRDLITSGITYFDRGQTAQSGHVYGADLCHIPGRSGTHTESGQHVGNTDQQSWKDQSLPPEYNAASLHQARLMGPVTKSAVFPVGDYMYNFEFLIHNSLPESINTELISTRYYLEALIEPSGAFSSKIVSQLDVPVIRLPAENSLELVEPIVFSRKWREQLYYDVYIFGKCFPLGSQIPMKVKLTPLANVQCHWIRVYVSQHVQYRKKGQTGRFLQLPTKRVLLFEKQAGLASYSSYPGSTVRITSEGTIRPSGIHSTNLLGEELETSEIKLEVQLPRCQEMGSKERTQRLHFSTKGGSPEVNHWIQVRNSETPRRDAMASTWMLTHKQIVLCLSVKDKDGMGSNKPRPVELTIESPFTILSCKATPVNIYVPPYALEDDMGVTPSHEAQCDCGGGPRSISLASRHEAEAPETERVDNSMSVKIQIPRDITRQVSFDSISSDIKRPARAHLPDWDLLPDELHRRAAPCRNRQWYGG
ncbi:hypothetical protein CNMCM5793_004135 [Aspergillus hiratsukae]|uniref:Arrestin C-terminal-like domain-containing protein n=1 Tax=Aspergillus hiratsukae TaxID=1194566 RepID=A0A8H6UCM2_9EURO|nr:hypothetical protein CNMCM5793_004135 [Aspergillus hiratsukae]KAF7166298.1 hypothetical protein CNMCM6106_002156 [Aspergillus hiratsukae]